MNRPMANRYAAHSPILPLSKGFLYDGEDLSLKRKVLLYITEFTESAANEEYIRKLGSVSPLTNDGFLHILDTAIEGRSLMVVLKHKPGKPLIQELSRIWTFSKVVSLAADLGAAMLDAMEKRHTGFSVAADNLWLGEDGRLSVVNYWEDGEPERQGAVGLCNLMIQLFSGSASIPDAYAPLDIHVGRMNLAMATAEQKHALVKLVGRVCQGQTSLSSLVFELRGLAQASRTNGSRTDVPSSLRASAPADPPRTRAVPGEEPPSQGRRPAAPVPAPAPSEPKRNVRRTEPPVEAAAASAPEPRRTVRRTEPPVEAAAASESTGSDDDKTPFYYRKSVLAASAVIVAAFVIWVVWPSPKAERPRPASATESVRPTETPVAQQTQESKPATAAPTPTPPAADAAPDGTIPNLVGMTQAQAEKHAVDLGFHYNFFLEPNEKPKGTVFKQNPEPGSKAVKGDNITFWVSKGP